MRIAILYFPLTNPERLIACSKALAEGLISLGHHVDLFNIHNESQLRLGLYDYICVGTQGKTSASRKIDSRLAKILEGLAGSSGKRCFAFVTKQLFFADSILRNLMKSMETQGLFIRNSMVLHNVEEARQTGLTLEVAKRA